MRVCIPTYLLPFLPPIREQLILESECAHDYMSIYMIIDKNKVKNPIIFYGLFGATLKCNKLNDEELSEESLYDEFEIYKDIGVSDFEVIILDDDKYNLIPTEIYQIFFWIISFIKLTPIFLKSNLKAICSPILRFS